MNFSWNAAIRHFIRVHYAHPHDAACTDGSNREQTASELDDLDEDLKSHLERRLHTWLDQRQAELPDHEKVQPAHDAPRENAAHALALPSTPGSAQMEAWIAHQMRPVYEALAAASPGREEHVRDVLAWFQGHAASLTRETARLLRYNLPALGEIWLLRTIAPPVIEHMRRLILEENAGKSPRWFTHVLWGFALAHEHGARGEVRGTPRQILDWLREQNVTDPSVNLGKLGHALPWLERRSPLLTAAGRDPSGAVLRVVHLDWFGAPPAGLLPN